MSEIRNGVRHVLSVSSAYNTLQAILGAYRWRKQAIERYVVPELSPNAHVIDIGCGTGEVVSFLPQGISYRGFDRNPNYIAHAASKFSKLTPNVIFSCEELSSQNSDQQTKANVILALGLLHHLNDDECVQLFKLARSLLVPEGFFLTLDPVYLATQSPLARWIISKDRGTEVRASGEYINLALTAMNEVQVEIDNAPLRVPYSGIIMKCRV